MVPWGAMHGHGSAVSAVGGVPGAGRPWPWPAYNGALRGAGHGEETEKLVST